MSRNAALCAVLLSCLAFPSVVCGQAGYCRVYRTMTMGSNVACYYCLQCPNCNDPKGVLGTLTDETGSCSACDPKYCFPARAPMDPGEAAPKPPTSDDNKAPTLAAGENPAPLKRVAPANVGPAPLKIKKFTQIPSVLYDPDITTDTKKQIIGIDVTDDNVVNPITVFLVTAVVKPKQADGTPYPATKMGFAHEIHIGVTPTENFNAFDPGHGPGQFLFKYKGHDCIGIIEVP